MSDIIKFEVVELGDKLVWLGTKKQAIIIARHFKLSKSDVYPNDVKTDDDYKPAPFERIPQLETKRVIFIKKGATFKSHHFGEIGKMKNNELFNKEVNLQ